VLPKTKLQLVPVAYACNLSYSGGKRLGGSQIGKPAQANSSQYPISKTPSQKRAGRVAQGEGPEFKPQYGKKKKVTEQTIAICKQRNSPLILRV
jgi:hypothetical protein